jgi:hypothetical protein
VLYEPKAERTPKALAQIFRPLAAEHFTLMPWVELQLIRR